jgi:ParB family chromosome partitioning protein
MSGPKGAEKAMAKFGANMAASIRRDRPGSSGITAPPPADAAKGNRYQGVPRIKGGLVLKVAELTPDPDQPRKEFDPGALERMAASLRQLGQLQPIRVRWDEPAARWVIVSGERRWRGAGLAGIETLDAIEVRGDMTDEERLDEQLQENCVREDLSPLERARAFRAYMDRRGWPASRLAAHLNVAPSTVTRALEVLELPAELQGRVESGDVSAATARALARVDDPGERAELLERAAAGEVHSRQVRERVERPKGSRFTFAFEGGTATFRLDQPDAPHSALLAAIRAVLAKATGSSASSAA